MDLKRLLLRFMPFFLIKIYLWWFEINVRILDHELLSVSQRASKQNLTIRKNRLELYSKGIKFRFDILSKIYFLDNELLNKCDVAIDCGVNIGEVSIILSRLFKRVIGLDIVESEVRLASLNTRSYENVSVFHAGLWKSSGSMQVFEDTEHADSPIIDNEVTNHRSVKGNVSTYTIADFLDFCGVSKTEKVFLKLEAEGLEPEILETAAHVNNLQVIAVDVGFERISSNGNRVSSLPEVIDKLLPTFEFVDMRLTHGRLSALFIRKQ